MSDDLVTLTLPMTQQGLNVVLTAAGVAVLCGAVYLMLASVDQKGRARGQRWLEVLGWIFAPVWMLLFVGTMWQVWLILNLRDSALGEAGLGAGALIAALLGAPFVIWGTWLRHKTQRLEQEGHMTDRITKAVEQLGAEKTVKRGGDEETVPNLEVRIGAILSLERIAQDSTILDKGRDHVRVMEILCAYIRENSNARKPVDFPLAQRERLDEDSTDEEKAENLKWREARFALAGAPLARQWAESLTKPRVDVQMALNVIGRRTLLQRQIEAAWPNSINQQTAWSFDEEYPFLPEKDHESTWSAAEIKLFKAAIYSWSKENKTYKGYRLNFQGANLQSASLISGNFSGALFNQARMEGAHLKDTYLRGAYFDKARMEGVSFAKSKLEGTSLSDVNMEGAFIFGSSFDGADISTSRLDGVMIFSGEEEINGYQRSSFRGCDFRETYFDSSHIVGADLSFAKFDGSWYVRSKVISSRLHGALLSGATFDEVFFQFILTDENTRLFNAIFKATSFQNTNLEKTDVTCDQLKNSFGDTTVQLPSYTSYPENWPNWNLPMGGENGFQTQWREWQADPVNYNSPKKPDPDAT